MSEANRKKFENFKLRMNLLRIWFLKNILVFVYVTLIVLFVCLFTGAIPETTPIIGELFAPLIITIETTIAEKKIDGVMAFFSVFISIISSVAVFAMKLKSITLKDIKSDKLKYALVKANLYFNEDNKLVRKTEKMTQTDLNGDGKIDDEVVEGRGLFGRIKGFFKEFFVIATAKFDDDITDGAENNDIYKKALEDANLEKSKEAIDELSLVVVEGVGNFVEENAMIAIEDHIEEESKKENPDQQKISVLGKLSRVFTDLGSKIVGFIEGLKKEKLVDEESIENNNESLVPEDTNQNKEENKKENTNTTEEKKNDSNIKGNIKVVEDVSVTKTTVVTTTEVVKKKEVSASVANFLNSIK